MNKSIFQVLLYYRYVDIKDPEKIKDQQRQLCEKLNLKGRIIVAKEGINGTLEGTLKNTEKYIKAMEKSKYFKGIVYRKSKGTGSAFPKFVLRVRDDIVSSAIKGLSLNPKEITGKYITPEELHSWIHSEKEFFLVDMRNDYETDVGYFKNSILSPFENFRDLPKILPILENIKGKTIVTVCTGGVRCEKASGFLLKNGFSDVYQLEGGIVTYMEKYPNEDFLGTLYVFDGRITMGFNIEDKKHVVVGKCKFCLTPAEKYYDCKNLYCVGKRHFISCEKCIQKTRSYCIKDCDAPKEFSVGI